MHITPSNLSIPASLSLLLPLGQFASDSNLFCTPQHKQLCPTTHFCEQPSPLPMFTSSQLPPRLSWQQPQPQTCSLSLLYVGGEEGSRQQLVSGDSWLQLGRRHHHCYLSSPQPSHWPNPGWPHKWGAQGALRLLGQLSGLRQPLCLSGKSRTRRASWGGPVAAKSQRAGSRWSGL